MEECFEEYSPVRVEGDNYFGYIGFREPFSNSLIDDRAMDVIVSNWEKQKINRGNDIVKQQ